MAEYTTGQIEKEKTDKSDIALLNQKIDDQIGHLGWYQLFIIFIVILMQLYRGGQGSLPVFVAAEPIGFDCEECFHGNKSVEIRLESINDSCVVENPTIISDFNLYDCGKNNLHYLKDWASSIYFIGYAFGCWLIGTLSSLKGRRFGSNFSNILMCVSGFSTAYSPNIYFYLSARFLSGVACAGFQVASFTYILELSGQKYRSFVNFIYGSMFGIGMFWLSYPAAYFFKNWRDLCCFLSVVILLPTLLGFIFQVESWRWLLAVGRVDEAVQIATNIGKKQSGESFDKNEIKEMIQKLHENTSVTSNVSQKSTLQRYKKLFKNKKINKITFILWLSWICNAMVYYGISLNTGRLPGSVLFNNAVYALMDIPALLAMRYLSDHPKVGRRLFQISFLVLAGVCCLVSTFILEQQSNNQSQVLEISGKTISYLGKFFIAGSFQSIIQLSSEIYSTDIRTDGFGLCSLMARAGGIVCPFIVALKKFKSWLPGSIFGVCGVLIGSLCFYLPETRGREIMLSMEEMLERYA